MKIISKRCPPESGQQTGTSGSQPARPQNTAHTRKGGDTERGVRNDPQRKCEERGSDMKRTQTTRLSRLLAVLLCLCMILPVASVPALAEGEEYAYTYPDDKPYYEVSMYAYACTDADVAQNLQYPTSIFRLLDA